MRRSISKAKTSLTTSEYKCDSIVESSIGSPSLRSACGDANVDYSRIVTVNVFY
jgi:hypothetical protein